MNAIDYCVKQEFHYSKVKEEGKFSWIPQEVISNIFSYLNANGLARCLQVNKQWHVLANNDALWKAFPPPEIAFGKKQWATYFGDVGNEPPLPKNMRTILKSPCPFSANTSFFARKKSQKKIEETHVLVLIPETVNGEPLNFDTLGKLVQAPKKGHANEFKSFWTEIMKRYGDQATRKSHWVLMTKNLITKSINEDYRSLHQLVATHAQQTGIPYEVPHALDVATCLFTYYVRFKECLLMREPSSPDHTCCQEETEDYYVAVGSSDSGGVKVFTYTYYACGNRNAGVVASAKFF